jgi:hypothetical protein
VTEFDSQTQTGQTESAGPGLRAVRYRFGRYAVTVCLGQADEFIGIIEVSVPKDFRDAEQRLPKGAFQDVTALYEE